MHAANIKMILQDKDLMKNLVHNFPFVNWMVITGRGEILTPRDISQIKELEGGFHKLVFIFNHLADPKQLQDLREEISRRVRSNENEHREIIDTNPIAQPSDLTILFLS